MTDGIMSSRIKEIEPRTFNNIPVECQIWDIERIFRVCFFAGGKEDIEIDFKSYTSNKGIPCLEASSANNEEYKSYLCIIPGEALANIYDKYGSQLLEGNVRSFLSTKVAVNKKIRETILSMPEKFFAYNNGVSATAKDLQFEETEHGRIITYAKDFQIINGGGQTTASLSNARFKDKTDLSDIFVQMKLTEIDTDEDRAAELVRNISRSSNSQNKVSDADFFATHPFHIRIEQISRRVFAPATGGAQHETKWFYERARGQYLQSQMRMTKSQKDKFTAQNPKSQLIKKTDLAKYRNTWDGNPHIVSKGAQTNFMKYADVIDNAWQLNDSKFNDTYFKDSVALAILFKHTENLVSHQSWYEQGYRANIVTYSIALLHKLIKMQFKGMDLNLQLIWNKQSVPNEVSNELVKITKYVFEKITDPNRETINVTQWCKRENCWKSMSNCDITLDSSLRNVLESLEAQKVTAKAAQSVQKLYSEVEAQTKVLEYPAEHWKELRKFVNEKKVSANSKQLDALRYAEAIPTKLPSGHQAKLILELLDNATANGFKKIRTEEVT